MLRPKTNRNTTVMDHRGRVFVHRDLVKAMGLTGGGKIEWFINQDGQAAFQKTKSKKKFK
jgi:hypothetical protein